MASSFLNIITALVLRISVGNNTKNKR